MRQRKVACIPNINNIKSLVWCQQWNEWTLISVWIQFYSSNMSEMAREIRTCQNKLNTRVTGVQVQLQREFHHVPVTIRGHVFLISTCNCKCSAGDACCSTPLAIIFQQDKHNLFVAAGRSRQPSGHPTQPTSPTRCLSIRLLGPASWHQTRHRYSRYPAPQRSPRCRRCWTCLDCVPEL